MSVRLIPLDADVNVTRPSRDLNINNQDWIDKGFNY